MTTKKHKKSKKNTKRNAKKPRSIWGIMALVAVLLGLIANPQIEKNTEKSWTTAELMAISSANASAFVPKPIPPKQETYIEYPSLGNFTEKDIECLAKNIFYEARGTSYDEMIRVINVTLNRVNSERYPDTICKTVHQYKQFSWTLDERKVKHTVERLYANNKLELQAWEDCLTLATIALVYGLDDKTNGAMWYHTHAVKPSWAAQKKRTVKSDWHIYYNH